MDAGMEAEKGKVTRGRRSWTKVEEDALIQCLVGIVNDGWKADNGFKAGFQRELEKGMRKLIPGTDILANPHINSKIHVWKKSMEICLICWERVELGGIPQLTPLTSLMRACGMLKRGATGENARDPADIVDDIHQSGMENQGETGEKLTPNVPETVEIDVTNSVCKPSGSIDVGSTKGKKRKMVDNETKSFVETIGSYMKSSDETFNNLAQRMGTEHDAKIARTSLNGVMNLIPGLLLEDKLKVSDELVQNTKRLEYFLSLPLDEQTAYVSVLLNGKL
ncbi:hypothetical protein ACS0TY_032755 [Phlomoides rotata]